MESVQRYARETLIPFGDTNRYLFQDRIKEVESLAEKLEGGRYRLWSELDDLYACTLVVPTAESEEPVVAFLGEVFEIVEVRSRDNRAKPPEVFRFDTTRVICRLRQQPGLERPPGAEQVKFEVQVPSVFQYAWSVVTRDFVYKGDAIEWRRERLVAQLKAAVEQIETTIAAFETTAQAVVASGHRETDARTTCLARFMHMYEDGLISEPLRPASWKRLAENVYGLVASYTRWDARDAALVALLDEVEQRLRALAEPPVSGSLFQFVLGVAADGGGNGHGSLDRYPVVDSLELREIYQVATVPLPVEFDLPV